MKIQTFSSTIRRREMDAVLTCMVEEKLGPGELNLRLVQQAKEFFKVDGAVAVRSPAIALKFALKALGLQAGDKVMISALAPSWQILTIEELGFQALVLDVVPDTAQISPETVHEGMVAGGKVLLLHETLGFIPNIMAILETGVHVIEDISQSVGATLNDKSVGTFGTFSILGLEEKDMLTSAGGAILLAPQRKDWLVLKKYTDEASTTDILPDMNCALALVQLKEQAKNEAIRKDLYEIYIHSLMQSKHHSISQNGDYCVPATYSFPVVLESGYKDVKQYCNKKEIEIELAFQDSVIALREESLENCKNAKSLYLRCVLFPLYPRLGKNQSSAVAKVLSTLP